MMIQTFHDRLQSFLQVSQIWGNKPSGMEANETSLHPESKKQDKVE